MRYEPPKCLCGARMHHVWQMVAGKITARWCCDRCGHLQDKLDSERRP